MSNAYVKKINGKEYRYKRIDGTEKYIGPVDPVLRGKIEKTSPQARQQLKQRYEGYATLPEMVRWFKEDTGVTVSGRTITNYMNRHGVKRGFRAEFDMSAFMKNVHAQKRAAKTAAEKTAVEHLKVLIEDRKIKPADVVKLTGSIDVVKVKSLWEKHTARKKKR